MAVPALLTILQPIWLTTQEPARRTRGRGEEIWDFAKVHGWCTGENPFRWKGNLQHILPRRQKIEQRHFAAIDYGMLPAFVADLRKEETLTRLAIEFLIDASIWTVPGRMKAGQTHRIPLSSRATEILEIMRARRIDGGDYVFPSEIKPGRPISYVPLYALLPTGSTLHGFRSDFRDWVGDATHFAREVAEAALAHTTGGAVELAYRRGDALEKRRALMDVWAQYCQPGAGSNVVPITRVAT